MVLAIIVLNGTGNLALAWGMKHASRNASFYPISLLRAMLNPFVLTGIVLLVLWLLTRMAVLSWADLSFVMPLTGIGYIFTAALGKVFLKESITATHWIGTLLIVFGTALVGSTSERTQTARGFTE